MPIPSDSVGLDLDKGEAFFCLSAAQMPDMGNLLTALWGGGALDGEGLPLLPVFPSTVSLEARWFDAGSVEELRDEVNLSTEKQVRASNGGLFEEAPDTKPMLVLKRSTSLRLVRKVMETFWYE